MVTKLQKLIIFNQNISWQNKYLLSNTATLYKLAQKPPVWQRSSEQGALYNQLTINGQPYTTKRNQPKLEEDQNTSTAEGDGAYRSTPEEQGVATGRKRGGSRGWPLSSPLSR